MRLQFILSEIGIGLRRNLTMTVSRHPGHRSCRWPCSASALLAAAQVDADEGLLVRQGRGLDLPVRQRLRRTPTLRRRRGHPGPAGPDRAPQLESLKPLVEKVYYESKQEAYDRFKQQFKDSPIVDNVTADQMPESFRVKLTDPKKYDVIASAFSGRPGVEPVKDQRKLLEQALRVLNGLPDRRPGPRRS